MCVTRMSFPIDYLSRVLGMISGDAKSLCVVSQIEEPGIGN